MIAGNKNPGKTCFEMNFYGGGQSVAMPCSAKDDWWDVYSWVRLKMHFTLKLCLTQILEINPQSL